MRLLSGRNALLEHAPEQAIAIGRLENALWEAAASADAPELFDLAVAVVAAQHALPRLDRPVSAGGSARTEVDAAAWRRIESLDARQRHVLELAEQFAFDVASVQPEQQQNYFAACGESAVPLAQAIYVADLLPRAYVALDALFGPSDWSQDLWTDATSLLNDDPAPVDRGDESASGAPLAHAVDEIIRVVPALQGIDPLTTELVRLLGARKHRCRVCQSVRSYSAFEAGGDDALFDAVENFESEAFDSSQRAALAFAKGMLSSPADFDPERVAALRSEFDAAAAVELVLDITRNATNKIAVALGGDAPRVETGYEIYEVKPSGEILYGLEAP